MKTSLTLLFLLLALGCLHIALPAQPQLDGEEVYRQNCRRCHTAIHTFSPRMMATVVHHMQVRATLTRDEEAAVRQYLLETTPAKKAAPSHTPAAQERTDP